MGKQNRGGGGWPGLWVVAGPGLLGAAGSERSKVAGGPERRLPPAPVLLVANAVVGIPLGGREDDGGLGWPALSSAYGPLSSTTTAGTTHQLLSRHQEGKMEEGTKRLEREVSSSTVRRVQTILEITSPKPLIAQSRTEAQNVQFHQPNKEAEFP